MEPTQKSNSGMYWVIGIIVIILIIVGIFVFSKTSPEVSDVVTETPTEEETDTAPATTTPVSPTPSTPSTPTKQTYTLAQIAVHNKPTDCWFAIEGKVYNVTAFIAAGRHPGGEAILEGCGKDATVLFNTRPMGSGTAHSEQARKNLVNFYIGDLAR